MVDGGEGDWLQFGGGLSQSDLHNPYFGSEMPNCGNIVHQFRLVGSVTSPAGDNDDATMPDDLQP